MTQYEMRNGRSARPPFVYFIHVDGFVKIGTSICPRSRFHNVKVNCPHPVTMLALIEGSASDELAWHVRFEQDHVRGEWFKLSPTLRREIAALLPKLVRFDEGIRRVPTKKHRQLQRRTRLACLGTPVPDMSSHQSPTAGKPAAEEILLVGDA